MTERSDDEYDSNDSWGESDYVICRTCNEIEDKTQCDLCNIDFCANCTKFKYYRSKYICETCINGLNHVSYK